MKNRHHKGVAYEHAELEDMNSSFTIVTQSVPMYLHMARDSRVFRSTRNAHQFRRDGCASLGQVRIHALLSDEQECDAASFCAAVNLHIAVQRACRRTAGLHHPKKQPVNPCLVCSYTECDRPGSNRKLEPVAGVVEVCGRARDTELGPSLIQARPLHGESPVRAVKVR